MVLISKALWPVLSGVTTVLMLTTPAIAGLADGVWIMEDGKVTVKVGSCCRKLCGEIVVLKEPISKTDGKPKVDRENPDKSLRDRPLLGLPILIDMKPVDDARWDGAIYNPDDGKICGTTLKLESGKMRFKACVAAILYSLPRADRPARCG